MALKLLEGFVQIFADRTALDKTLGGLQGDFQRAGTQAGTAFRQAFTQVTPQRAVGAPAGPPGLSPITVGGVSVPPEASIFSRQGQLASRAVALATGAQGGATVGPEASTGIERVGRAAKESVGSLREAQQGARIFAGTLLSEVNPAAGQATFAIVEGARAFSAFGVAGGIAGGALAALVVTSTLYIGKIKELNEAQIAFNLAVKNQNLGALTDQLDKTATALDTHAENTKLANQEITGLRSATSSIVAFWSNAFAPAADDLTKRLEAQRAAYEKLFFQIQVPKDRLQALIDSQKILQGQIALDKDAAESASALTDATNRLIQSKQAETTASANLVRAEKAAIENARARRGDAVTDELLAQNEQKARDVEARGLQEIEQIRRQGARSAAEFRATDEEDAGKQIAFARRRTDAVLSAAKDLVEVEAATNLSLEQAYRTRTQLQEAQTASQIKALEEQTAAQRQALQARVAGATGDERVQLERELTNLTQEEASKRVEIETQATVQRIKLAQQERTDRINQAQQVFAIQSSLGERRLADELRTQAAIANAAKEGSMIQIAAIQRVAELQGQIQNQARSIISQTLSVAQQQAQRLGIEGPAFVSPASLQRDLERQRTRDEEIRARFQAGQSVRTEELQSALGNQPFFEQFKGLGGQLGDVFKQAVTPLKEAFESTLGPAVTEQFTTLASKAQESFVNLVANVTPAFQGLEKLVSDTMDRIVQRIQAGNSEIVRNITAMVEDNLTRALRDAERRS